MPLSALPISPSGAAGIVGGNIAYRAKKVRGHGTWEKDRLPSAGVVGRESGQVRLRVCEHSDRQTLHAFVETRTAEGCTVNTDEWQAYSHLPEHGRTHKQVCQQPGHREWARDEDGDGGREVHSNTAKGMWTGLRNHLRPFCGVNKEQLHHYIAVYEWAYNYKRVTNDFLRALMMPFTLKPT